MFHYQTRQVTEFRAGGQKHTKPVAIKTCDGNDPKLLDQIACASRYAGSDVVTLSVGQKVFRHSIQLGKLVTFLAAMNHTGNSSMEIGIMVIAENIHMHETRHVDSCLFTMVPVLPGTVLVWGGILVEVFAAASLI
jgi:hypothetical protein